MKKYTDPLQAERYYHVFNRGINSEVIFKTHSNYIYFLEKLYNVINKVALIQAYCLLQNHFHLLIKTKSEIEIRSTLDAKYAQKRIEYLISKVFSDFFNGYAQAFNKQNRRTGGLFEEPYRRKEITNDTQLSQAILYIHLNPVKHKLPVDYKTYEYSSFSRLFKKRNEQDIIHDSLKWFGTTDEMIKVHESVAALYISKMNDENLTSRAD